MREPVKTTSDRSVTETVDAVSLRTRKKQRTRQEIVEAAAMLFAARGFDRVTVAEIARAADVSEQTVYNYFPTKEQLVFDEEAAFEARFVSMVRDRPESVSPLDAVRTEIHLFLDQLGKRKPSQHRAGGMPYLVATSPTIRRYWLALAERYAHAVSRTLSRESAGALPTATANVIGFSLLAPFVVVIDELGKALLNGDNIQATLASLRPQLDKALDIMAHGFSPRSTKS
jgi:AcrR family transcriptional regulator